MKTVNSESTLSIDILSDVVDFLANTLDIRLSTFFEKEVDTSENTFPPLAWNGTPHPLAQFCAKHQLSNDEFLILVLALVPHVQPYLLDNLIQKYLPQGGSFPQIGGVRAQNQRSFLPTGETALFLLGDDVLKKRLQLLEFFKPDHFFMKKQVLWLEEVPNGEPELSGRIILSEEYVDLFTIGKISPPKYSAQFPAKLIKTRLEPEDLVIQQTTAKKLKEIERWLKHGDWLQNNTNLGKRLKPGYRALFYGPPGTGKTLAATIMGNQFQKSVYRIDLSQIISKYIGETEKNLSALFDKAENKGWILFFDEADALFGKRVNVKEAKDKYANQETAYLLQKIEDYPGLVVLATNLKDNIDKAFIRRFHSIVHFPMPGMEERLRLWKATLPAYDNQHLSLSSKVRLTDIAQRYKLSGANINNIVQYCSYLAKDKGLTKITNEIVLEGILREYDKEGKNH